MKNRDDATAAPSYYLYVKKLIGTLSNAPFRKGISGHYKLKLQILLRD